jgi:hypothetical protein
MGYMLDPLRRELMPAPMLLLAVPALTPTLQRRTHM